MIPPTPTPIAAAIIWTFFAALAGLFLARRLRRPVGLALAVTALPVAWFLWQETGLAWTALFLAIGAVLLRRTFIDLLPQGEESSE